jgi:hypothetical protein
MKMSVKKVAISLPDWVFKDLELDQSGNRSARIQELMIKGYLSEQKKHQLDPKKTDNSLYSFPFPPETANNTLEGVIIPYFLTESINISSQSCVAGIA